MHITDWGTLLNIQKNSPLGLLVLSPPKIVCNSVLSTTEAKNMYISIKNMYLETPMDRVEYMKIPVKLILQEFMDTYNLHDKIQNGFIYMQIKQEIYCFK